MRDFFKPMRRKLALVTVTLLVTTSYLWVRSFQFPGGMSINVDLGPSYVSTHFFGATYKGFEWIRDKRLASSLDVGERERIGHSLGDFDLMNDDDGCKTIWRVNLLGFVTGAAFFSTGTLRVDLVTLVIPYWMAFISLALLSAWLLLSKPRPTKPGGPPQS